LVYLVRAQRLHVALVEPVFLAAALSLIYFDFSQRLRYTRAQRCKLKQEMFSQGFLVRSC